jgi:RNA polymerase sigma factor (sigma-70 family)
MPTVAPSFADRLRPRLARLAQPPTSDADLLRRFVSGRDEDAFAELVRRHGPAVLAVCRRITGDPHDADDAFQAAFLVLARKADRVRPGEPLAGWLYGVAVRAARAALARRCRRRSRERPVAGLPDVPGRAAEPLHPDDARAVLAEVARLSPGVRAAVVLCELEGRSRAAAARELGIPEGTLSSRLAAARKTLAARLRDRGLAAAVLAAVAASARGARPVWSSDPSSPVAELAEAVMRTGLMTKYKFAAAVVVAAAGLVAADARPAAPEVAPAPRPADPTRLIVGFAGHVRYLTPDGREVGRVTGDQVKAAGADFHTRQLSVGLGNRGLEVNVSETFAPAGRAAPDGRLPLNTKNGLYLLGDGPAVTPVKAKGGDKGLLAGKATPQIAAWSPDGAKAVGWRSEERLFAPNTNVNTLIDLAAGTAEPLKLPDGHRVMDWSPDGAWFLTLRADESFSFRSGWSTKVTLCKVSADGKTVEELVGPREFVWYAAISPDGAKVAYGRGTTGPVARKTRDGTETLEVFNGFEVVVHDLAAGTRAVAFASPKATKIDTGEMTAGVRWSPDGTRLGFASFVCHPARRCHCRVRVCDADGGNPRVVLDTDPAADAATAHPTVFDWR